MRLSQWKYDQSLGKCSFFLPSNIFGLVVVLNHSEKTWQNINWNIPSTTISKVCSTCAITFWYLVTFSRSLEAQHKNEMENWQDHNKKTSFRKVCQKDLRNLFWWFLSIIQVNLVLEYEKDSGKLGENLTKKTSKTG